ncbi:MAG: hypothetical protein J3K34DRAFT_499765 [Monoraphidium minutum]|nr:MAG: hypothetical protein J3K34DRAFT_499765 [Monoraphidium minutum]
MPAPAVACSPPTSARSPALPIGSSGARSSSAAAGVRVFARVSSDGGGSVRGAGGAEDAASPLLRPGGGASRFSFSSSASAFSRSQSAASGSLRAVRPPAGPSAVTAQNVLVGFDAPPEARGAPAAPAPLPAAAVPASPGRRGARPSLLSLALSDLPAAPSLSSGLGFSPPLDLFGATSPSGGFSLQRQDSQEPDLSPLDVLATQHPVLAAPLVRAAYAAAARAHAGQRRKSGEPVISHCLETAVILADLGLPVETVAAGLLHDVLADTRVTAWQLEEYMPRSCVELVEKVTRLSEISQLYRDNAHSLEAASILDMLTTMSDVSALLIKLADRLHNMRTIGALPRCKQVRMASETLEVFAVLANRLGAWAVKAELEDLAFKTLQPEDYEAVHAAVAARTAAINLPARVAQVRAALAAAGLDAVDVSGRVKNIYGVWRKLAAGGLGPDQLEQVYDVAALRVVVPHKHDCYRALREVEGLWAAAPGRFKDYIRNRKGNGYQSLHTTVLAGGVPPAAAAATAQPPPPPALLEVQIRTPKMHYIAEYGFAAHWRYKEKLSREDLWLDRLVQWKKWVAAEKLRLRDAKVRAAGSPQRDLALAALVEGLALTSADGDGGASLDDGGPPAAAAAAAAGSPGATPAAERDARFSARFSIRPVAEADVAAQPATILISGPRGVRLHAAPAGTTIASLLASAAVSDHEAPRCSVTLNGAPLPLLGRRDAVLRPGDHVAFVHEPTLAPRAAPAPAPAFGSGAAAGGAAAGGGGGGGGTLDVYLPGREAPVEVALIAGRKAAAPPPLRPPTLVS